MEASARLGWVGLAAAWAWEGQGGVGLLGGGGQKKRPPPNKKIEIFLLASCARVGPSRGGGGAWRVCPCMSELGVNQIVSWRYRN